MSRVPVPFIDRRQRLPQAGRIRSGVKGKSKDGKVRPKAIDVFRFTAPGRNDLDILATLYGGEVEPWHDPKSEDRFELITTSSVIQVKLPPDPLGDGPTYEMWGGKGLARSCDGITCEVPTAGPDGTEWAERPCLCRERGRRECKPKLRLAVILPQLPLRGVWRFDTGSDLAVDELPGMVGLILGLQSRGLPSAELRLERRQSKGGSHRFVVPALGLPQSFDELAAVGGTPNMIAAPGIAGELGTGSSRDGESLEESPSAAGAGAGSIPVTAAPSRDNHPDPDDEIVDAEVVEELTAVQKATALREARRLAEAEGRPLPLRYEEIDGGG